MQSSRRHFLTGGAAMFAAPGIAWSHPHEPYVVPAEHNPVVVRIAKDIAPNEIHVDPNRFYLYWTMPKQRAIRYVVGVGRSGLYESGEFTVGDKREWPSWKPTKNMIEREPEKYEKFADGVPGGPKNPLGARALYLHNARGYDTALRIHGTPQPWTIGRAVSNGCARLVNAHIVDLYERVPEGTRVVLHPKGRPQT